MSDTNTEGQNINDENDNLALDIKEDSEIFLEYLSESYDHLEEAESNILTIEENTHDLELVNAIFRNIHSIKGSAGFLGLADIQKVSHELEALLDKARKGEITITQEIIDICLNSIDVLRKLRENLAIRVDKVLGKGADSNASHKEQPINIQPTIDKILSVLNKEADQKDTVEEQREIDMLVDESTQTDTSQTGKLEENAEDDYIGKILVDDGEITQEQLDKALKNKSRKIGEIFVDEGLTTEDKVTKSMIERYIEHHRKHVKSLRRQLKLV